MHDCEWCAGQHDEERHEVLINLHMHLRQPDELVDDALATAQALIGDGKDNGLWLLDEEWQTVSDEEREDLDVTTEFLDRLESVVADNGYVALSDGGNTGDWLVLTEVDDEVEYQNASDDPDNPSASHNHGPDLHHAHDDGWKPHDHEVQA